MSDEPIIERETGAEAPEALGDVVAAPFPVLPALLVLAAVVAAAVVGAPLHLRAPAVVTLAPVAAVMAALTLRTPLHAALTAAASTLAGLAAAFALVHVPLGPSAGQAATEAVVAAVVAAGIAFGATVALGRSVSLRGVLALGAASLVVASMWLAVVQHATRPAKDGTTYAGLLSSAPAPSPELPVQATYLAAIESLRAGRSYYASAAGALATANRVRTTPRDLDAPLAVPPPTLYVSLSRLPEGGVFYLLALLACGTAAVVATYAMAARYAPVPVALACAYGVAGYVTSAALTITVLDPEPWSGVFGVLGLSLLALALAPGTSRPALAWPAAAAALAAALLREPGAVFVAAGLAATLADPGARARRSWLPWALASAAAAVAIAAHTRAAAAAVAGLTPAGGAIAAPRGIAEAFTGLASVLGTSTPAVAALALIAVAALLTVPRPLAVRAGFVTAVVAAVAAFAVLPSANAAIAAPVLLAAAPLALALLPEAGDAAEDSTEAGPTVS